MIPRLQQMSQVIDDHHRINGYGTIPKNIHQFFGHEDPLKPAKKRFRPIPKIVSCLVPAKERSNKIYRKFKVPSTTMTPQVCLKIYGILGGPENSAQGSSSFSQTKPGALFGVLKQASVWVKPCLKNQPVVDGLYYLHGDFMEQHQKQNIKVQYKLSKTPTHLYLTTSLVQITVIRAAAGAQACSVLNAVDMTTHGIDILRRSAWSLGTQGIYWNSTGNYTGLNEISWD